MREDIESESREKSTKRYATSHRRHGGNTGSGNMTVSDTPDGQTGKSVKKKEKKKRTINVAIGY